MRNCAGTPRALSSRSASHSASALRFAHAMPAASASVASNPKNANASVRARREAKRALPDHVYEPARDHDHSLRVAPREVLLHVGRRQRGCADRVFTRARGEFADLV